MKIWMVARKGVCGYDEYDAFVCAANTEDEARHMHPNQDDDDNYRWEGTGWSYRGTISPSSESAWVNPSELNVFEIGEAKEGQEALVILASFNAG